MKIAFLNIYNGKIQRGSEIFVHEIATCLSANHQITVFQSGKMKNTKYRIIEINNISNNTQGLIYDLWVLIFTLKCLPHLLRSKFDWIIPVNGRWQTVLCKIISLITRSKLMIAGHAGVGLDDRLNILFGRPDIFVALSPAADEWAKSIDSKLKVVYIPNGVNIKTFHPQVTAKKIPLKPPVILCVSALLAYKRIDLLIRALEKLPLTSLLLIGDGPLKKELVELGTNILKRRFLHISHVSYQDIPSYYKAATIFSLPSKESEAFGLVYLEALACNIPIVAPDDRNRRNIIGNAGLYCDPQDAGIYAQTLQKAINFDFNNKPRLQAEKFSWEKIAIQYEKILSD